MSNLNLNKVILAGRITKDIELKNTPNGLSVAQFTVAVNRDAKSTDFFNIVAWRSVADFVSKYFRKGSAIFIEGRMENREWESNGKKCYRTEIVADSVKFVDSKTDETYETPADEDLPF